MEPPAVWVNATGEFVIRPVEQKAPRARIGKTVAAGIAVVNCACERTIECCLNCRQNGLMAEPVGVYYELFC